MLLVRGVAFFNCLNPWPFHCLCSTIFCFDSQATTTPLWRITYPPCLSEVKVVPWAKPLSTAEASWKHWPSPRNIYILRASYPSWQGCILFIPDLGYSDLRGTGPHRSAFQSAPRITLCSHHELHNTCSLHEFVYCQTPICGLWVFSVNNCSNPLFPNRRESWHRDLSPVISRKCCNLIGRNSLNMV